MEPMNNKMDTLAMFYALKELLENNMITEALLVIYKTIAQAEDPKRRLPETNNQQRA